MKNIVILGSGRSGTSLLASMFSGNNIYFGDNYLGQDSSNPKGYFEDNEINEINDLILSSRLPLRNETFRRIFTPWYPFHRARWLAMIKPGEKLYLRNEWKVRMQERLSHKPFCYKDPRFSYTLPLWYPYMDDTLFLCVFRHPSLTANSILRECRESKALHALKLKYKHGLKIWRYMYLHILEFYKSLTESEQKNWLFIHYDQLFEDKTHRELELFTNLGINKSMPDKSISRSNRMIKVPSKYESTYLDLCSLANYEL